MKDRVQCCALKIPDPDASPILQENRTFEVVLLAPFSDPSGLIMLQWLKLARRVTNRGVQPYKIDTKGKEVAYVCAYARRGQIIV